MLGLYNTKTSPVVTKILLCWRGIVFVIPASLYQYVAQWTLVEFIFLQKEKSFIENKIKTNQLLFVYFQKQLICSLEYGRGVHDH